MRSASRVSVFDYKDYRAYLNAWYADAKTRGPGFSHRAFAKRAGLSSTNFFMLVMQGKRNLTESSIKMVMRGLKLNKQEQEFFRNLVFFNQARMHEDKDSYYRKLLQSKKFRQAKPIERESYEYYSSWYHPVVRELVVSADFDGTPEWIAGRISPPITSAQAAKSIELLVRLGFIERTESGKWKQASTIISTGPEVTSIVVHRYHKELLDLSKSVMDRLSMKERDVSSLTLGVKRERLPEIMAKIREFRQEILKMVSMDTEPEEVAQLNIQFYPVTNVKKEVPHEDK